MLLVERQIPYSQVGLGELKTLFEQERASESKAAGEKEPPEWWRKEQEQEKEGIIQAISSSNDHDCHSQDADGIAGFARHRLKSQNRNSKDSSGDGGRKCLDDAHLVRGVGRPVYYFGIDAPERARLVGEQVRRLRVLRQDTQKMQVVVGGQQIRRQRVSLFTSRGWHTRSSGTSSRGSDQKQPPAITSRRRRKISR